MLQKRSSPKTLIIKHTQLPPLYQICSFYSILQIKMDINLVLLIALGCPAVILLACCVGSAVCTEKNLTDAVDLKQENKMFQIWWLRQPLPLLLPTLGIITISMMLIINSYKVFFGYYNLQHSFFSIYILQKEKSFWFLYGKTTQIFVCVDTTQYFKRRERFSTLKTVVSVSRFLYVLYKQQTKKKRINKQHSFPLLNQKRVVWRPILLGKPKFW